MKSPGGPALDALQKRLRHQFLDHNLLLRALTHRSAQRDHNERLEFLGDALIGMVAAAFFCQRFPDVDEGTLSRLRSSVVRGKALAKIAEDLDISDCLILGESERKSGGRHRSSILADTLEALAGAIMLDSSIATAQAVVEGWLQESMLSASPEDAVDAKTRLQEWLQARGEDFRFTRCWRCRAAPTTRHLGFVVSSGNVSCWLKQQLQPPFGREVSSS